MPLITVQFATSLDTPDLKGRIAGAVTELSRACLGKDPAVTALIVNRVSLADWFAGGASLQQQNLASFWVDIHITEGTNTKDEKAAFIRQLFNRMAELIGPLHNESYAHVDEVRGDAYGFGGLTQEQRYIERKLSVSRPSVAAVAET